jgi:hypothetical protein
VADAAVVLTDSGGLQEETTALGVPCITMRENTERPVTVDEGTNTLAGTDPRRDLARPRKVLRGEGQAGAPPATVGRQGGRAHRGRYFIDDMAFFWLLLKEATRR